MFSFASVLLLMDFEFCCKRLWTLSITDWDVWTNGPVDPDIRYSGLCLIQFDSCTAQSLGLFELLSKLLGPGLSKKVTLVHLAALTNSNPSRVQSIAF